MVAHELLGTRQGTAMEETGKRGGARGGQLTARGIAIGSVGCVIITAASIYTALKMGALPWPIVFAALISLFFLRALGSRSLNEANVTHTIMSAGAMVAGGLAFTIPGIWILGAGEVSFVQMLLVALAGSVLGLVASAILRRRFVGEGGLEFPIGRAAAETLKAGDAGGRVGLQLFGAMGISGVIAFLRDALHAFPALLFGNVPLGGVVFGVYVSPMMMSVGFLVGTAAMVSWFCGGVIQLVLVAGAPALGLWDDALASAFNSSLGMGVMIGCGVAVVVKDILWKGLKKRTSRKTPPPEAGAAPGAGVSSVLASDSEAQGLRYPAESASQTPAPGAAPASGGGGRDGFAQGAGEKKGRVWGLLAAALGLAGCLVLGMGPLVSEQLVLLSFVTVAMAAQSAGQTGIDPMEIFGLIVLLLVALVSDLPQVQLFFVAAVIAVACGLGGDVMNDFKAGAILGTDPRAQVAGQAIGGIIGAIVAAIVLFALVGAYGPEAFGVGHEFVSAQANVVATLVQGIPHVPAFALGVAAGFALYLVGAPAMMVGLGIYLPFYMTFTAFIGCVVKAAYDAVERRRAAKLPEAERPAFLESRQQTGLVVASGLLGGESIVGVICALVVLFAG